MTISGDPNMAINGDFHLAIDTVIVLRDEADLVAVYSAGLFFAVIAIGLAFAVHILTTPDV